MGFQIQVNVLHFKAEVEGCRGTGRDCSGGGLSEELFERLEGPAVDLVDSVVEDVEHEFRGVFAFSAIESGNRVFLFG